MFLFFSGSITHAGPLSREPDLTLEFSEDGQSVEAIGHRRRVKMTRTYPLTEIGEALSYFEASKRTEIIIRLWQNETGIGRVPSTP